MRYEDGFPEPIGVFRAVERPRYDAMINDQVDTGDQRARQRRLGQALPSGDTWDVA